MGDPFIRLNGVMAPPTLQADTNFPAVVALSITPTALATRRALIPRPLRAKDQRNSIFIGQCNPLGPSGSHQLARCNGHRRMRANPSPPPARPAPAGWHFHFKRLIFKDFITTSFVSTIIQNVPVKTPDRRQAPWPHAVSALFRRIRTSFIIEADCKRPMPQDKSPLATDAPPFILRPPVDYGPAVRRNPPLRGSAGSCHPRLGEI